MAYETTGNVSSLSDRGRVPSGAGAGIISTDAVVEETVVAGETVVCMGCKSRDG